MKSNDIPTKEYDYLLSMPLWSLTEERVADLESTMTKKKDEHDTLEKLPIFNLWNSDISQMLEVLTTHEVKEEKERS